MRVGVRASAALDAASSSAVAGGEQQIRPVATDASRSHDRWLLPHHEIKRTAVVAITGLRAGRGMDVDEEPIPEPTEKQNRLLRLAVDPAIGLPAALGANAGASVEVDPAAAGVHLRD